MGRSQSGESCRITESIEELRNFLDRYPRLWVLTGAGCSTESGIPDYRDRNGDWKRKQPVTIQDFVSSDPVRRRYWARSLLGWPMFERAIPNQAHHALVRLEQQGRISALVTQNVDRLHQRAGSQDVVDLHGRLDQVICLQCRAVVGRAHWQLELAQRNKSWEDRWRSHASMAPDGDADLADAPFDEFAVPACSECGGMMKPDVVFFGETVPRPTVELAMQSLASADAVLVVGSSLMVFSGFRFVRAASEQGLPVAAISLGKTRADDLLQLRAQLPCSAALSAIVPWVAVDSVLDRAARSLPR